MPDDDVPDCCFDEWAASNAKKARTNETTAPITAALLNALDQAGLEGRTVLDVGCGTGDLALAALGRGARSAAGFDLGAGAIANARALAQERGLSERATFQVGDGTQVALPRSDVVVLNRVVCCYPSADALLANTLGAAGNVFAFTAPVDRGLMGLYNRILWLLGTAGTRCVRRSSAGFACSSTTSARSTRASSELASVQWLGSTVASCGTCASTRATPSRSPPRPESGACAKLRLRT